MTLTEPSNLPQVGQAEGLRFRDGLAIGGDDVVMAFTYTPLCTNPSNTDVLEETSDCLSDVFADLSPHHRGRAIVEFTGQECRHWLLLHVGPAGAHATAHMMAALELRAALLTRLREAGLNVEIASVEACNALVNGFPQPHVEDRRVVDHHGRTVVTLTLRESGEVTRPGITRDLVHFLCSGDKLAYLVLDFRNKVNGLCRLDLSLVLTANDETEGEHAASRMEDMVMDGLGALVKRDKTRRAVLNTLHRMSPFARAEAKLPACVANVAHLFPL